MGTKMNTVGTILASVFITLLISGAGIYFGLPLLFPNIVNGETTNGEVVIQSKYQEFNSSDQIRDDDLIPSKMLDTEMNITTQGNTKLSVSFDVQLTLLLSDNFNGGAFYHITLQIEGVKNETVELSEYYNGPIGELVQYTKYIEISFETGNLPASTYNISVLWNSKFAGLTSSTLYVVVYPVDNCYRTISAQEIMVNA
ncbi:hypothetical protein DSAG12_02093 [Promethearchaeum syntrophicum]|uniref:DUF1616 domain-containing protein n=1 Tax=Promethearchaeum syntrophicum TaxID=2594042 RepID=A0A5B9DAU2_9ARCH|nr:hypothetical protein [Candidatus Prometheoarchaeum syntrophicum]QEE16263.1 hypothetical protein DSAG12_02093 [Candidatus Prometheoarchaeum syntrophicum]